MTELNCTTCGRNLLEEKEWWEDPKNSNKKYCLICAISAAGIKPIDLLDLLKKL